MSKKLPPNGFLYSIYSKDEKPNRFFEHQFLRSLESLKNILPDCSVTLYTNIKFDNKYKIDNIIEDAEIPKKHIAKAYGLLKSPYKKTVFLDTDTIIHREVINDIFTVLDEFDFACCAGNVFGRGSIFPDYNTGLLGVKKNSFTNQEIKKWIKGFEEEDMVLDQKHFREIFMRNKTKFYTLPWWFQHRYEHFDEYKSNRVITHSQSMSTNEVTKQIKKRLK